jgi:quercetin dioxygenase-like cupin family protein
LTSIKDGIDLGRHNVHERGYTASKGASMNERSKSTSETLASDRASALTEMVDVAEGAIVSRVLASSGGGNVTLFAFDQGQGLSEHTAPFDALVQVVNGSLELTIGGVPVNVEAGEIVRMPANVPHALQATEASRMLLTMLRDLKVEE